MQNIVSFIGLFCKRDLKFNRSYYPTPPHMCIYNIPKAAFNGAHGVSECDHTSASSSYSCTAARATNHRTHLNTFFCISFFVCTTYPRLSFMGRIALHSATTRQCLRLAFVGKPVQQVVARVFAVGKLALCVRGCVCVCVCERVEMCFRKRPRRERTCTVWVRVCVRERGRECVTMRKRLCSEESALCVHLCV